jgi:rhodanese-related sulfurtransferase
VTAATIDAMLAQARQGIARLTPREAYDAASRGALLVDIRPEVNRRTEGEIPGALVIDRNVLEWRLDPASEARLPMASYDAWIVLVCNEGYASSLAAASLQQLGVRRATDLEGGYRAWRAQGLPNSAAPWDSRPHEWRARPDRLERTDSHGQR